MEKSQIGIVGGVVDIRTSLGTIKLQATHDEGGTFDVHLKIPAKLSSSDKETLSTMFAQLAQGLMAYALTMSPSPPVTNDPTLQ